jgi:hypothetical protein
MLLHAAAAAASKPARRHNVADHYNVIRRGFARKGTMFYRHGASLPINNILLIPRLSTDFYLLFQNQ